MDEMNLRIRYYDRRSADEAMQAYQDAERRIRRHFLKKYLKRAAIIVISLSGIALVGLLWVLWMMEHQVRH